MPDPSPTDTDQPTGGGTADQTVLAADDQQRLDEALAARDALTAQLEQTRRPTMDQYSESILYSIRSDAVRRLHEGWTPFFGRIDTDLPPDELGEGGQAWIGPYAVHDQEDNRLLVQSWRAPTSAPFYEATASDPMHVITRRRFATEGERIAGVVEEHLAAGEDDFDSLRHAIVRQVLQTRTGSMQDIMTTITPEQHQVIRTDTAVTVLQGGPGTGKTAVGLHRIAYLLFADPDLDALIVGPSDRFLAYVGQVLPALGEDNVRHLTLAQLGEDPTTLRMSAKAPRHLLGDPRMETLMEACAWTHVAVPDDPPMVKIRDRRVTVSREDIVDAVDTARATGMRYLDARAHFRDAVVTHVAGRLERRLGLLPTSDVIQDIKASQGLGAIMRSTWPALTPTVLLRKALTDADLIAAHVDPDEAPTLHRAIIGTSKPRPADTLLTALHELADEVLGGAFEGRRYGHIVIDEAQELTSAELRMVRRRLTASGQITMLGDLSQQMGLHHNTSWADLATDARLPDPAVRTLETSYRVPADVLALAAPYATDSELVPAGVRDSETPPAFIRDDDLAAAVGRFVARHPDDTVGVIAPDAMVDALGITPSGGVSVVPLTEVRGLEFGHVVAVEPAALLAQGGPGGLYIALTRAVKTLTVVYREALPDHLAAALPQAG